MVMLMMMVAHGFEWKVNICSAGVALRQYKYINDVDAVFKFTLHRQCGSSVDSASFSPDDGRGVWMVVENDIFHSFE